MSIEVSPLNVLGSANPFVTPGSVTNSFQDLFTRANNVGNWGNRWGDFNTSTSTAGAASLASINANRGVLTGATGNTTSKVLIPIPLMWMSQTVKNQFSELTLGATSLALAFGVGPIAVVCPTMGSGSINQGFYYLQWNNTNTQLNRYNWNGATQTAVTLNTVAVTWTTGDVMRLECVFNSPNWSLTGKKNGTSIITATDAGLIQGCPGIYNAIASGGVSGTNSFSEYAGGTL